MLDLPQILFKVLNQHIYLPKNILQLENSNNIIFERELEFYQDIMTQILTSPISSRSYLVPAIDTRTVDELINAALRLNGIDEGLKTLSKIVDNNFDSLPSFGGALLNLIIHIDKIERNWKIFSSKHSLSIESEISIENIQKLLNNNNMKKDKTRLIFAWSTLLAIFISRGDIELATNLIKSVHLDKNDISLFNLI